MKPQSCIGKEGGIVQLGLEEEWEFGTTGRRNRRSHVPGHRDITGVTGKGPVVWYCMACLSSQRSSMSTEQRVNQDSQNPYPQGSSLVQGKIRWFFGDTGQACIPAWPTLGTGTGQLW